MKKEKMKAMAIVLIFVIPSIGITALILTFAAWKTNLSLFIVAASVALWALRKTRRTGGTVQSRILGTVALTVITTAFVITISRNVAVLMAPRMTLKTFGLTALMAMTLYAGAGSIIGIEESINEVELCLVAAKEIENTKL